MPKFYCLYNSSTTDSLNVSERIVSLKSACKKFGVQFVLIDESTIDLTRLPKPTKKDGLFNCARGSVLLEYLMLNTNVRTFYRTFPGTSITEISNYWSILHNKMGIATPKTVYKGVTDRLLLKKYVSYLEGFPIVVKTYGGTGGIGVIKIDNYATLFSIADYLIGDKMDFAMKQFIPSKTCERLTVLGDKVIAGICRPLQTDDFRSDAFDLQTFSKDYSSEINSLAIKAVNCVNLNLAGVDIIIDERNNKPYVLEINFPLNFVHSETLTGVKIAERMVEFLFDS